METILIIGAVAGCVVAGTTVAIIAARARRPPLRLSHDLDEADEALLLHGVEHPGSPIDRSAETIDLEAQESVPPPRRRLPGENR